MDNPTDSTAMTRRRLFLALAGVSLAERSASELQPDRDEIEYQLQQFSLAEQVTFRTPINA